MEKHAAHDIAKVLNQLIVYAEMHFRHEETIMRDAGYPKLEQHQLIHDGLIENIFKLQQSYEDKSLHLEMNTMKFVKLWLIDHILQQDYLFRDFLSRKKPTDSTSTANTPPDTKSAE